MANGFQDSSSKSTQMLESKPGNKNESSMETCQQVLSHAIGARSSVNSGEEVRTRDAPQRSGRILDEVSGASSDGAQASGHIEIEIDANQEHNEPRTSDATSEQKGKVRSKGAQPKGKAKKSKKKMKWHEQVKFRQKEKANRKNAIAQQTSQQSEIPASGHIDLRKNWKYRTSKIDVGYLNRRSPNSCGRADHRQYVQEKKEKAPSQCSDFKKSSSLPVNSEVAKQLSSQSLGICAVYVSEGGNDFKLTAIPFRCDFQPVCVQPARRAPFRLEERVVRETPYREKAFTDRCSHTEMNGLDQSGIPEICVRCGRQM